MSAELHKAARWYARYGWRVHPCKPREKLPLVRAWQTLATTDLGQVDRWWSQWPDANVAVATGEGSGVYVVDVDVHNADGEATLLQLLDRFGSLPPTPTQRTGSGGRQFFLAWPAGDDLRNSAGTRGRGLGLGIDTRGNGGFVVVPPSTHPCGDRYRWLDGLKPTDLAPAPIPPAWLERLRAPPPEPRVQVPVRPHKHDAELGRQAIDDRVAEVAAAPRGQRNTVLYKAAFRLAVLGLRRLVDHGEAMRAMRWAGEAAGLPSREVQRTIQSAEQGARQVA